MSSWREEFAPVMLEAGWTFFNCRLLEDSLCLLLALMAEHRTPSDGQAFSASWDFHSDKTLGQLLRSLKQMITIPSDLESSLRVGLQTRNAFVHRFFRVADFSVLEPKGRLELIDQLREQRNIIRTCDKAVNLLIDTVLEKYGTFVEELKENADRLFTYANEVQTPGSHETH